MNQLAGVGDQELNKAISVQLSAFSKREIKDGYKLLPHPNFYGAKMTYKCRKGFVLLLLLIIVALNDKSWAFLDFDFSNNLVPLKEIKSGGVSKDGIPAVIFPEIITAKKAVEFMKDSDRVMGLSINKKSRAYPIKILNWHELVNDRLGERDVLISFCPLCGTGLVFDRRVGNKELTFAVSGLLYNSDLLFYDHHSDSLWSQIEGKAITGKFSGSKLKQLPSYHTTWDYWKKQHPETTVALPELGYMPSYEADEYAAYNKSNELMFPVSKKDTRFHPKETIIGVRLNGVAKAYFYSTLEKLKTPIADAVGGQPILVHYDKASSTAYITNKNNKLLNSTVGFWFAWYAFNSDTLIYNTAISSQLLTE